MNKPPHIPVLLKEVIEQISPKDGGIYVDGTFGAGGYSRAVLQSADCTVYAIDRDPDAIANGQSLAEKFSGRLKLLHGTFGKMKELLDHEGIEHVDGVMLDIGVSSMQIDQAERGFSFQKDGVLDMRMSQNGLSAADVVNKYGEKEIADIIYLYGEERYSRRIAAAIVSRRRENAFLTTLDLAHVIRSVVPHKKDDIDPATRTFQALRIYVNDELEQLRSGLTEAEALLNHGGRMAVVSFHSLEDRIVKNFIAEKSGKMARPSRYLPDVAKTVATLKALTKKPITPSSQECLENPRSRSARLRSAERI
ncbi:MAG: 16S rRNA (cytosine(1402)-N(4))-methyltransferase RsmH [Alphaproteobacteria bacterium]|nr:16S rRNA (cytosine(1402)-N(4))-methyltransferase RsmH [Alphaproteobacteria bacterium]